MKLSLIVASFGDVSPVNLPLASIELPPSLPQADVSRGLREKSEHQQGFHRYEERRHTFSIPPADQMPPMAFCLLIAAATFVVPWVVFAFLVRFSSCNPCRILTYLSDFVHRPLALFSSTDFINSKLPCFHHRIGGFSTSVLERKRSHSFQDASLAPGIGCRGYPVGTQCAH